MRDWHVAISGGSQGIGFATAQALATDGMNVHLMARRELPLRSAAEAVGGNAYACDISKIDQIQTVFEDISLNTSGRLDGLVVNAAKYGMGAALDTSPATFRAYLELNLVASLELVKHALPLLRNGQGKSIVMVSSTLALKPVPGTAIYAASKAALDSLTMSLALELASEGIRVNAVLPGVVNTPIHEPQNENEPSRAEKMKILSPLHPLGRVGSPDDIAAAIKFLISPASSWMTGVRVPVDGGISIA